MSIANNPTQPDQSVAEQLTEILVAWRDHVERLEKWNGKLPTDEAVAQLKALLLDARIDAQLSEWEDFRMYGGLRNDPTVFDLASVAEYGKLRITHLTNQKNQLKELICQLTPANPLTSG